MFTYFDENKRQKWAKMKIFLTFVNRMFNFSANLYLNIFPFFKAENFEDRL